MPVRPSCTAKRDIRPYPWVYLPLKPTYTREWPSLMLPLVATLSTLTRCQALPFTLSIRTVRPAGRPHRLLSAKIQAPPQPMQRMRSRFKLPSRLRPRHKHKHKHKHRLRLRLIAISRVQVFPDPTMRRTLSPFKLDGTSKLCNSAAPERQRLRPPRRQQVLAVAVGRMLQAG
jgi:hypothetical protein